MKHKIINSFLYLIPSIGGVVLPLITFPLFTKLIPISDFGNLALLQIFASFIISLINFGLPFSFERNFFELNDIKKRIAFLYTTLLFILISFSICFFLILIFSEYLSLFITGSHSNKNLLILSFISTGISSFKSYFLIYFKNMENAKKYVIYTIDENLFTFVFSIIFVLIFHFGIYGIVYGQLFSSLFVFILLIHRFIEKYSFSLDLSSFKDALIISLPLTPRSIINLIGQQVDKFIAGKLDNSYSVGILSFAQKISNGIFILVTAFQNVWGPKVYKLMFSKDKNANETISKLLTPFFYFSLIPALLVNLFSKEIAHILFKNINDYKLLSKMIILFTILQASIFFNKQNQLLFKKHTRELSFLALLAICITFLSNFIAMKYFGLNGLMWSIFFSGIFNISLFFYRSQKAYRIIWNKKLYFTLYLYFTFASLFQILVIDYDLRIQYKVLYNFSIILFFLFLGFIFNIINKSMIKETIKIFTERLNFNNSKLI